LVAGGGLIVNANFVGPREAKLSLPFILFIFMILALKIIIYRINVGARV
jgi:hypothetical protein